MRIFLAYLGVVLIWSTTPLAIKWSSVDVSYVFGVTARMSIGAVCLFLLMLLARQPLKLTRKALQTYLAVALQLYLSMLITYWGAQFIPSGWVSVIFGLSPFMTAFLAAAFLNERSLGIGKLISYIMGVIGLLVMFNSAWDINALAIQGMIAMLIATFLYSVSSVWVKQIHAQLPALTQISGGMLFALPAYLVTWYWLDDAALPDILSKQTQLAILYLGMIATPIGFALFYYLLLYMPATSVAMITLVTPIFSLVLGYFVNQEPLTLKIALGTGMILLALAIHAFTDRRRNQT
ncbi:MAG: DMT family transporter [Methylomonas sp.]|uniref:DMT family transporter n=1 Tax=Methylomonas sp. TaxID=418 RepID=UPI0025FA64EE|nr:DMT family transporter [Methylomonas sp.]MCK9607174.1 DMT family transporter [Methylomonas sp.]